MTTLVAQVAPQRSSQYAELARVLAPAEIQLSPLGSQISGLRPVILGGQEFVEFQLPSPFDAAAWQAVAPLAMTTACYQYYDRIGAETGPFLRPIETSFEPALSPEIVMTRRYKGKTNELFTFFMLNVARFSSAFAQRPWGTLRVFDPLAGGGTTVFAGLVLGCQVAGVEQVHGDCESTATFVRQYCREQGIPCREREERLRKRGHRWTFEIGQAAQKCVLAHGDTVSSRDLVSGFKPDLIVADLPYGIQHQGTLAELLTQALPVWSGMLVAGGALVLAWDATRFSRPEMLDLARSACPLTWRDEPPYDALAHRVDRVIKRRDVLVGQRDDTKSAPVSFIP